MRSSNGCWTCRLRRKKCDENHPICGACAGLYITCHFGQDKPVWMDGGVRQGEEAFRLKREIKENAQRRHTEYPVQSFGDCTSGGEALSSVHLTPAAVDIHRATRQPPEASDLWPQRNTDDNNTGDSMAFGRSDAVLFTFYLETLLPFLFPFYRPSILQGDKSWILNMLLSRPVVREAVLCQSFYFFSLMQGAADYNIVWEKVLLQNRNAFEILREALQVLNDSDIIGHPHCAVRILASIIQLQRFEIAVLSFGNWQAHLNATLALFEQLLKSPDAIKPAESSLRFEAVMDRLGSSSWMGNIQGFQISSAEQSAFLFSSAHVILDDIIASMVLQKQPRLYKYHRELLDGCNPPMNLEAIIGLKNWTLLYIGEIAALDAWKQRCRAAGNLDVIELAYRATSIKESVARLMRLETDLEIAPKESNCLLDIFPSYDYQPSKVSIIQSCLATRIWTHAALIYLSVVVSGWQPNNFDIRYHVGQVIELLKQQISPPALLHTMVWPFCVAGCLAEPSQEATFRGMAVALQPQSVFGTVHKALEIMENVWRHREAQDVATRDLAACFRHQGDLVLLV